jgi:hypothetical protein
MIFPASWEISFNYEGNSIFRLPGFLCRHFVITSCPEAQNDLEYYALEDPTDPNNLSADPKLIAYLQAHIKWSELEPFVTLSQDSKTRLAKMWESKRNQMDGYSIQILAKQLPDELFHYTRFNQQHLSQLFCDNELYLPSPSQFNDPFDCSLDEPIRLACIEWGIGCFSAKNDNILMFSHYANDHRGICFGVNPQKLADSIDLMSNHKEIKTNVRPVWYFSKMPPLDFRKEPALCVTCKHDVWKYEEEYRLFLVRKASPLPSGTYKFGPESLTSVIFGCRASDKCISFIKTVSSRLPGIRYFKACRQPKRFGVHLLEITKL